MHLRRVYYRVLLALDLRLHHNRTLTHRAFEVAIGKSALVFMLVLIDGLRVGAINAAGSFLLWRLRVNFSGTVQGILHTNLNVIAGLI